MVLVKEARSGHTAVAFASSSKINDSIHAAAEHFSNFLGTFDRENDDKVLQVQFHHLGDEDQLVWETWNTPNGTTPGTAPAWWSSSSSPHSMWTCPTCRNQRSRTFMTSHTKSSRRVSHALERACPILICKAASKNPKAETG